uniref:Uncharacterized protein n=1 Tax=Physcomitrium patens TaxID=3218 RepID=A0A2K1IUS3_PHYPA|nr:hypothetical protein PHYPA_024962 [Physcomitrium patens]PNR33020.1 hypothetical protein PHYPA_024963 [Physcomitrium patens]
MGTTPKNGHHPRWRSRYISLPRCVQYTLRLTGEHKCALNPHLEENESADRQQIADWRSQELVVGVEVRGLERNKCEACTKVVMGAATFLGHRRTVVKLRNVSKHRWSSGRIVPCHGTDPGSIPGRCRQSNCHASWNSSVG